ncbi:MAG: ketopantoate reductase family protein [Candidatus Omnitrophica bacterium]|nr:ketopantoate reductase family protein [Candidatus Omnitrophota bacterium]
MKIAVIGAGAIGSVVAAFLKKSGRDIILVGKKEQADAINSGGIKISYPDKEEVVNVKVMTKLDKEYDLVIFTTKTQDLEDAYQHNNEYLDNCLVMTTQNGVQGDSILGVHIEKEKLLSSIVMFGSTYLGPGEVIFNFDGDWIIGKPYTQLGPDVHKVADELKSAFKIVVSNNITGMKWLKLFVNFNNCIPALVGKSMQETFSDMSLCRLSVRLLKEGFEIVKKANIDIISLPNFPIERISGLAKMPEEQGAAIINKTLTSLSKVPLYGSILQSIMRKKTSEIDFINGEVVRLATQIQEKADLNDKVVDMVHDVENKGRFYSVEEVKKEFNLIN